MNAENELLHAYHEWLRLARAETKAIQTRNWDLLSDCQLAIKDFQAHIASLTQEARAEWQRAGCSLPEKEKNLRVFTNELIDLTQQNKSLLQSTLTAARKQLDHLGNAGKNLKLLQRSYGFVPAASRVFA
jgi:septal ring factor EnvC (AmiA/AmiB activator)